MSDKKSQHMANLYVWDSICCVLEGSAAARLNNTAVRKVLIIARLEKQKELQAYDKCSAFK